MVKVMNRVIYETDADKLNEQKVAERIVAARPYSLHKLPPRHAMDYAAIDENGIRAFVEIKCRTFEMGKYPTAMIGMDKVLYARNIYHHFGINSFLFVQWTDKLAYVSLQNDCTLAMGGRTDRSDPQDVGVYAFFAVDQFKGL